VLARSLQQEDGGNWKVTLDGGAARPLPASYHYVNWKFRIDKTIQTQDKLDEILKGKPVSIASLSPRAGKVQLHCLRS
jgi:hypothetical protein